MGDVFDAMTRSRGKNSASQSAGQAAGQAGAGSPRPSNSPSKPRPLDLLDGQPVRVETGAGLPFDEARLADRDRPLVAPLYSLPAKAPPVLDHAAPPPIFPGPNPPSPSATHAAGAGAAGDARRAALSRQYRQIRDAMRGRATSASGRVHVFASPTARDGRTAAAINLGVAFSELPDCRTVLLEADLHAPTFHRHFQKPFTPGLAHLLRGELVTLDDVIHATRHDALHVLPAGDCVFGDPDARTLLAGQSMIDLMMELRNRYDHILVDAPPLGDGDQACLLATLADESLLVIRAGHNADAAIESAKRHLRTAHPPVAGVILTHG